MVEALYTGKPYNEFFQYGKSMGIKFEFLKLLTPKYRSKPPS